jgi:hypothetical protein
MFFICRRFFFDLLWALQKQKRANGFCLGSVAESWGKMAIYGKERVQFTQNAEKTLVNFSMKFENVTSKQRNQIEQFIKGT